VKYPYAVLSDQHAHSWSQFSKVNEKGVNSRLQIVLDEMLRAAKELLEAGGDTMVFAGDLFHVRGSIDPEVFNAVHDTIQIILAMDVKIVAVPGNHDLKGKETTELGNAIQTLGAMKGFEVVTEIGPMNTRGRDIVFIPWQSTVEGVREAVKKLASNFDARDRAAMDLVIHAGINGVLTGMPDHGLDPAEIKAWGYRNVFAGHYHAHKILLPGVVSIGATAHQTWGDVGTKAGFLLANADGSINWRASHAPSFVDIDGDTDPDDIPFIVDGNYVRVRGFKMSNADIANFKEGLEDFGAKGVIFQVTKEEVSARGPVKTATPLSLEASVAKYIAEAIKEDPDVLADVTAACMNILETVAAHV